ncbi:butyrophilin subfamily 2 member A2 [Ictalurus punctatus]|uniref:Butyrophilin subfamily 2 member A2 n=1 Tax=Ictalurus punctatus TaxID=7998 RepID=A0A9F7R215_ICTPU|nr:butyrophilin subfamily 2 member A2 [Ictalurus punctatus]
MIPAPPLRWVLLILFPTLSHQTSGTFSVKVQSPASGFLGSSVSLHCALVNNMDARNLEVSWYHPKMQNTPILSYKNTQIQSPVDVQYQRRVFLLGELEKGDVSLKLENLTLADRGEYVCHVSSDNWYDKATVSLTVRVVGSTPVLSLTGAGGGQINVSCQSHGWLPEPSITWTDKEGRDLKHLSKDKFSNSSEGVVDVSSWLIVSPSESEWISCSVGLSDQERKEGRIMLFVPAGVTESWSGYFIVIPILLLLLLLLLLCAAGITVYRKKGLIFSKRKGTEYTEGTPSETAPLSNICMESQDQNDAPSIIPHSVVVDIDQPSEQREKTPPAPCPDLNQQKSSEQQNPEEVKETPHVAESREEDPGSCSSSPGFSTAGSTTDKPNFTPTTSNPTPAATISESATVSTTSAGSFSSANKHPTKNAERKRKNTKGRKNKDRANETESSFNKAKAREISTRTFNMESKADCSESKHLCKQEAVESEDLVQVKKFKVNITIDGEETPEFLTHEEKEVKCSTPVNTWDRNPDDDKIFTLCKEKFHCGKRYWEVKVRASHKEEKLSWFVGVASDAAERKYSVPFTPHNELWVLCYERETGLYIGDETERISVPDVNKELTAVGVFLDCDKHTLSFYNIDTQSHIYTFTNVEPKTPLRPLISPGVRDSHPVRIL